MWRESIMNDVTCQLRSSTDSEPSGSAPPAPRKSLVRSAGVISLATAASRVLGFVRDFLMAHLFGTGIQAQAFIVAFRLPNLLRDLVAEGAMTSAIVPVLSGYRATKSPEEFWRLVQALCVRVMVIVTVVGLLGIVAAPWCVRLIAPGFGGDSAQFELTVRLTRVLFPFITLVGAWAFFCGLLNTLHEFGLPALGPAMLNVVMIIGCVWVAPRVSPPSLGLAWAVMVGGVVQLAMQIPRARKLGFRWRWVWHHPGSGEVLRLLGPRLLGTAVYQMEVLFMTILASLGTVAGQGAVAALYFANRLVQLPLALFASASAQASLPVLSESAAMRDLVAFRSTILSVLRMVLFESLPAAIGLMVLARPIVQICFERGAFDHSSTMITSSTLSLLAIGLVGYAAGRVLSGAFYALRDTRTPVRLACQALVLNIVMGAGSIRWLHVGGLALATALASTIEAVLLVRALERRIDAPLMPDLLDAFARMGLSAALMGGGCWLMWSALSPRLPSLIALPATIVGGILVYGAACAVLRVAEINKVLRWIQLKRPTPTGSASPSGSPSCPTSPASTSSKTPAAP